MVEYYSAQKNVLASPANMGRKLKCVLLSASSHAEEKTYCVIPITGHSGKGETMETLKTSVMLRMRARGMNR